MGPSTDDLALQAFIRYDVYVNGELRAVVVGQATAEVEGEPGINSISVIAVDTADNESAPGTTTLISRTIKPVTLRVSLGQVSPWPLY